MPERRKRLIEVAFPLEEVSAHSRREKNIRHGHISTLHIWWARRPLAACRAFIYASLVDDPGEPDRAGLLKEVADLASWDAVRHPEAVVRSEKDGGSGLTGQELLEKARERILESNGGVAPRLLDPFAGGGAIPLEALRLGCEVEASDLNPVAVLILKGTVEYPQKFGQPGSRPVPAYITEADDGPVGAQHPSTGLRTSAVPLLTGTEGGWAAAYRKNPLAADVRYWGQWMLERAREKLAPYYPPDPDGSRPVAYLWSRTVPCPSCGAQMPLIRQYWLARKDKKKIWLEPAVDRAAKTVDFRVVESDKGAAPADAYDPGQATTSRGDTTCLVCNQVVKAEYVRQAGRDGKMDAVLTSVVLEADGHGGKRYRADATGDLEVFKNAMAALKQRTTEHNGEMPLIPDEPMPRHLTGGVITAFGYDTFGKLFNARQLVALTTFARLVHEAHAEMQRAGLDEEYAKAVATYLGLTVDRLADYNSSVTRWGNEVEAVHNTLARQAIPMVWDFAEAIPIGESTGCFYGMLDGVLRGLETARVEGLPASTLQRNAATRSLHPQTIVLTDPPYYDAINYADLSDFFYVWLKRSIGFLHPDLLNLPLTPKRDQVVMNVYGNRAAPGEGRRDAARRHYVEGMAAAFGAMAKSLEPDGMVGVVFAHTDQDAWGTLIAGLLQAELVPDASWPLDTELENKVSSLGQARLKTSVWMACRKRDAAAGPVYQDELMVEMRRAIRDSLLEFWRQGIRGADFFISAIGPALAVFGRHTQVLRISDGRPMEVKEFLDLVRREATQVALEQVLGGADLGLIDPITRQYGTWVWGYGRAALEAGDAIALCLATGADYGDLVRPHSIAAEIREKSKKLVKLRTIQERARNDDGLASGAPGRPAPLIDQLQYAAGLWGATKPAELARYREQLGDTRWNALRTLGQAVAECLPDGDEDRRLIFGLLSSNVGRPANGGATAQAGGTQRLPGF